MATETDTMDIEYANKRIDFIMDTLYEASRLCTYKPVDIKKIKELLATFEKALDEYYKYLHEHDVDPQDSYITAWYYKEDGLELHEEIENFIGELKSSSESSE